LARDVCSSHQSRFNVSAVDLQTLPCREHDYRRRHHDGQFYGEHYEHVPSERMRRHSSRIGRREAWRFDLDHVRTQLSELASINHDFRGFAMHQIGAGDRQLVAREVAEPSVLTNKRPNPSSSKISLA
jgi:hypothetical protein